MAEPGVGCVKRGGTRVDREMPRIVVAFPAETFEEVRARAVKHNTSFAEQVRLLVEWGLEADR